MSSLTDFQIVMIADEMRQMLAAGETPNERDALHWEAMGLDRDDQAKAWAVMERKHRARLDAVTP